MGQVPNGLWWHGIHKVNCGNTNMAASPAKFECSTSAKDEEQPMLNFDHHSMWRVKKTQKTWALEQEKYILEAHKIT